MFRNVCIRTKIVACVLLLLTMNTALILLLDYRQERRISSTSYNLNHPLTYNSFMRMILTGDVTEWSVLSQGMVLTGERKRVENLFNGVQALRNQILMVFALSLLLGTAISLFMARSISKPILQLANASKRMARGSMDEILGHPKCQELKLLTDSLNRMHEGLMERGEEKSRQESVELTKNLAAGIAHEIKNPINTVGLIVDYLQTNLSPDDPEKRYEFYKLSDNMKNELRRINRIVEGFLRLTKPDVFNFRDENVNSVIQETISILEPEIIKQGVKIQSDLGFHLPTIKADGDRLRQVFSNLIINAVEAMPRGGTIVLSTRIKDGDRVEVEIKDSGIGIPEDDIRKIFSPYYTTKKQGFGLGLSLTHNIIHKHNGKINVNSVKGEGTSFIIQLPIEPQLLNTQSLDSPDE